MKLKSYYIYLLGACSLIIASIFSLGYHQSDEHFQILEFAGLKLGLTSASDLAWEYHYQMRSSFQPFLTVIIYRFFGIFGADNPFFISFFLRLLSGGLAFLSTLLLYKVYKNNITDKVLEKWYLILSFLLWFNIYNGVRFSSENWSGIFFIIGFSCYFLFSKRNYLSFLTIGLLFGLSFLSRYQAAFLILGFSGWLLIIRKERFINITYIIIGGVSIVLVGTLIDKWFYGEWTLTTWNYFTQNIIEDKVSGFGVQPWWWYITSTIINGVPPFSLLFVLAFFINIIFKPKSPIVWSVLPFFIIHSLIGHKELRFMFPIIAFLPVMIIHGVEILQKKYSVNLSSNKYMKGFMKLFFIVNAGLLIIIIFKPADSQISLYHKLYKDYREPTVLYYISGNPYDKALDIDYYKRKTLSIVQIASIDDIPKGENKLVVLEHYDETNNPKLGKQVYSSFPEWIRKFNFNNWQERSSFWYVYEIR